LCPKKKDTHSLVDWLYKALNILDAKANGLLRFNAILVTALAVFLNGLSGDKLGIKDIDEYARWCVVTAMLFLGASGVLCFLIIQMSWAVMGKVEKANEDETKWNFDKEERALAKTVVWRRHFYFVAWVLLKALANYRLFHKATATVSYTVSEVAGGEANFAASRTRFTSAISSMSWPYLARRSLRLAVSVFRLPGNMLSERLVGHELTTACFHCRLALLDPTANSDKTPRVQKQRTPKAHESRH
jgi:hypothetical protein